MIEKAANNLVFEKNLIGTARIKAPPVLRLEVGSEKLRRLFLLHKKYAFAVQFRSATVLDFPHGLSYF